MSVHHYLDFEKPISDIEGEIIELKSVNKEETASDECEAKIKLLEAQAAKTLARIYNQLTPSQKLQVARHPKRPRFKDYARGLFTDFIPISGDRLFGEDRAITAGIGRFCGDPMMFIGHEKGSNTSSRITHNFGMPRPEAYRKALRITDLANRFKLPVISIVDTPGAYPGIEAEERGQGEAIAQSIRAFLKLIVPSVAIIVGEGGSGGALGIAAASIVMMLEHAVYSVISPEGAAAILWNDKSYAQEAANSLKITAQDLLQLRVIDKIIDEPTGGAHRESERVIRNVGAAISEAMQELHKLTSEEIYNRRKKKFLNMGRELQKQVG